MKAVTGSAAGGNCSAQTRDKMLPHDARSITEDLLDAASITEELREVLARGKEPGVDVSKQVGALLGQLFKVSPLRELLGEPKRRLTKRLGKEKAEQIAGVVVLVAYDNVESIAAKGADLAVQFQHAAFWAINFEVPPELRKEAHRAFFRGPDIRTTQRQRTKRG